MTQKEALDILKTGANAFITGAAGSGKTHLLREYISYLKDRGVGVGITASTGIAATHMGGITIHSWSGIGIKDDISDSELGAMKRRGYLTKRVSGADVLIIDEISMLHHFRLDLVDRVLRHFKRPELPFGGMQVVLSGDFFQLPPVGRGLESETKFAYHSAAWRDLDLRTCYLDEQHRQNDPTYLRILNGIRDSEMTQDLLAALRTRLGARCEEVPEPTRLYTHNADVDRENERELAKLPGTEQSYLMTSNGPEKLCESLKGGCLSPERLKLKVGARVIFTKNDFDEGYVNGTLGVVEKCDRYSIRVRTRDGRSIDAGLASWHIEDGPKILAEIIQYPLRLAWAITVHKSQGMSLDAAHVDLGRAFEKGMGYVALSRIRSLDGLYLRSIGSRAFDVDDEVAAFDSDFREMSARDAEEIRAASTEDLATRHGTFLAKFANRAGGKKEKTDTFARTKELCAEGLSVMEIAKMRDLTPGTVVGHIEKILKSDPGFDISHLRKDIPAERLERILAAFRKIGPAENGRYRTTPVRQMLGGDFSYEEIGLARLFI